MRSGGVVLRRACALLSIGLLSTLLVVAGTHPGAVRPPADLPPSQPVVGSTYLCTGYAGCRNAGYSDAGYGANSGTMYWRMYSGHNCTNYAAYRMVKAGMPNVRPWSGEGNASHWGEAMSEITDRNPTPGSIAWWPAYYGGHGSAGHVAYVERVISDTEIVISEDAWGGDFHWRRITIDSGRWPKGFIHFVDKTIRNTRAPSVTGKPQVGVQLTAEPGAWDPDANVDFQWLSDGRPIDGATTRRFTPRADQRGTKLAVRVTAKKRGFDPTTKTSAATDRVVRGELDSGSAPTISGDPMVDEQLTATPGTWTPAPDRIVYKWRADGSLIDGANRANLTLTRDLVGKRITVKTVARKEGYARSALTSERVGPVLIGEIEVTEPFAVEGRALVGEELTAVPGAFTPEDATVAYQWLRDGRPVAGATTPTYAVTGDDLGAALALQVTLSRRNYADRVRTVRVEGTASTRPVIDLRTEGGSGKAVVVARLTAPGIDPVPGSVTVRVGGSEVVARLEDGRARVVVKELSAGEKTVRVEYAGHGAVLPARAATTVRVTR